MFRAKTMSSFVYEALRGEIVGLKQKPGERLSEDRLAKKYKVSRAPIRAAIQKLQKENLVLVKPQVGTIVSPISLEKGIEICEVRQLLEPFAAAIAAERIGYKEEGILTAQFKKLAQLEDTREDKKELIFETDRLLHRTIWKLCGNREIESILEGYQDEMNRIRLATAELANRMIPTQREMKKIYSAIMKRNGQAAREAMQDHILKIKKAVEAVIRSITDSAMGHEKGRG